jgi:type II secretory pathway pseudopilin PulG
MIGILATIAVPRLLSAKNSVSAASAIATMRR